MIGCSLLYSSDIFVFFATSHLFLTATRVWADVKLSHFQQSQLAYLLRTILDAACPKEVRMSVCENEKNYVDRKNSMYVC